jgi:hypothetical protein
MENQRNAVQRADLDGGNNQSANCSYTPNPKQRRGFPCPDLDELALIVNWKESLQARLADACHRLEVYGLHLGEEANLLAEVVAFKKACLEARGAAR